MHAVHHPYIRHWLRHVDVQISSRDRFQGLSRIFSSITSFCVRAFLLIGLPHWNRNTFLNKLFENRLTTRTLRMVLVKLPFFWRAFLYVLSGTGKLGGTSFWRKLEDGSLADLLCSNGWPPMALLVLDGLLCPMLDATIGGFREGRNALQMFDWFISCLILFD